MLIFHALRSQRLTACILHTEKLPFFQILRLFSVKSNMKLLQKMDGGMNAEVIVGHFSEMLHHLPRRTEGNSEKNCACALLDLNQIPSENPLTCLQTGV